MAAPLLVAAILGIAYAAIVVVRAPRPRGPTIAAPREQREWVLQHDRYVARAMAGPVPLLFLGDSITLGWLGTASLAGGEGSHRQLWRDRYASRHAENFGVDGEHVDQLLWRLRHGELARIEPEVIVLLIGTNNIGLDEPPAIAAGIAAVVAEIRRRCPRSQVLLLGVLPRGVTLGHGQRPSWDKPDPRIAEINRRIAPLGDLPHVTYLDFGDRLIGPDGRLSRDLQPDLLHLSERGYRIWADAIEPELRARLGAPPIRAEGPDGGVDGRMAD